MSEKKFAPHTSIWSPQIEDILKDTEKNCTLYSQANGNLASHYSFRYNSLMHSVVVVSAISGILSTITNTETCTNYCPVILNIIITIFSFIGSLVGAIVRFSKFDQKSLKHKTFMAKYASLAMNIRNQLSIQIDDRSNPGQYLHYVTLLFNELNKEGPIIPQKVLDRCACKKDGSLSPTTEKNILSELTNLNGQMGYELDRFNRV